MKLVTKLIREQIRELSVSMSSLQAQFELQHGPFDDVDLEKAFSEMTFEEMDEWLKKITVSRSNIVLLAQNLI